MGVRLLQGIEQVCILALKLIRLILFGWFLLMFIIFYLKKLIYKIFYYYKLGMKYSISIIYYLIILFII